LTRVINPESGARRRSRLVKQMAMALRHAANGEADAGAQRDVFAFLLLSLGEISASVDSTVAAWEKRDYWVKADRFRMEWSWAEHVARDLGSALAQDDLGGCTVAVARLAGHIKGVSLPKRKKVEEPWIGAWRVWSQEMKPQG
jgi:hypothetical protein